MHSVAEKMRLLKATAKKLNEDRLILSLSKMLAIDSTFWQHKVYADIRRGSLERSHQMAVG